MRLEVGSTGHDKSRGAEAALLRIVFNKRSGNRVQLSFGREPFDGADVRAGFPVPIGNFNRRSEEHTSELQSLTNLVCRLLPEKKCSRARTSCRCRPASSWTTSTGSRSS